MKIIPIHIQPINLITFLGWESTKAVAQLTDLQKEQQYLAYLKSIF